MDHDRTLALLVACADLRTIYEQPNPIVLNKVLRRFDRHAAAFIAASRFVAMNVGDSAGAFAPVLSGGNPGFIRLVDEVTLEVEMAPTAWPLDRPQTGDAQATAMILVVPGVKETLRCKGSVTTRTETTAGDPKIYVMLRIDESFFHCAKAFMRSRVWDDPKASERWKGFRHFRCVRKVRESAAITSFSFVPADGGKPPWFQPGQHVVVEIARPLGREPLRRTYSLSNRPGEDMVRITVKREADSTGGSAHLHDGIAVGDVVAMRHPGGSFVLDEVSTKPIVLLSAGVGLTPLIAMLDHLVATNSARHIWFVHSANGGTDHAMRDHVREVARGQEHVRAHVHYTHPTAEDVLGRDHDAIGRLSVEVLKRLLPWDDYEFYICGPAPFMGDMIGGLLDNGVLPERVKWEAFSADGHAIAKSAASLRTGVALGPHDHAPLVEEAPVEFRRSGKIVSWKKGSGTLLEVAEANGVDVRSSCRTGECFTCATRILSGEVAYTREVDDLPDEGTALVCCAVPAGALVLDL